MSTDFFKRKLLSVVATAAAVVFTISALCYAWFLNRAERYPLNKCFYFLVDTSTHLEACVATATLQGGAGYIVADDTREYSALSVYLTESAGLTAKSGLLDEQSYSLLEKRINGLYFKTRKEKRSKPRILAAFNCLEDCIEILNGEIRRLEESATQRSAKCVLNDLAKQFSFLADEYRNDFPAYATVCDNAGKEINGLCGGIVYAHDLRYLCCSLCDEFVKLSEEFTL
ncbi:MAG: hypothetical protein IJ317_03060 [Clostridia bacterium]|nr:hypothetical protein [Clostridia bacterium]